MKTFTLTRIPNKSTMFPQMAAYTIGNLTEEQLLELFTNADFVLADSVFWMDSLETIRDEVVPMMANNPRRFVCDWGTRYEIYAIERNRSGRESDARQNRAKSVHNWRSLMHGAGVVRYLPETEDTISHEGILRTLRDNPQHRFVVLTRSKELVERINESELQNALPIHQLPTGDWGIRMSAKPLVAPFIADR